MISSLHPMHSYSTILAYFCTLLSKPRLTPALIASKPFTATVACPGNFAIGCPASFRMTSSWVEASCFIVEIFPCTSEKALSCKSQQYVYSTFLTFVLFLMLLLHGPSIYQCPLRLLETSLFRHLRSLKKEALLRFPKVPLHSFCGVPSIIGSPSGRCGPDNEAMV